MAIDIIARGMITEYKSGTNIDFKENEVKQAITEAGLKVVEINRQGEWINITAVKPDTED